MKKLLPVLLLSGCTVIDDREKKDCVEYMTYTSTKEECIGGRGVAPQICITTPIEKLFCTRYESSTL